MWDSQNKVALTEIIAASMDSCPNLKTQDMYKQQSLCVFHVQMVFNKTFQN